MPPAPWLDDFVRLVISDLSYLVELREQLFFHGPRETWPVYPTRVMHDAYAELLAVVEPWLSSATSRQDEVPDAAPFGLHGTSAELKLLTYLHIRALIAHDLGDGIDIVGPGAVLGNNAGSPPPPLGAVAGVRNQEPLPRKLPKMVRKVLTWFVHLLESADVVLGSLGAMIPNLPHALEEFKDILKTLCGIGAEAVPD